MQKRPYRWFRAPQPALDPSLSVSSIHLVAGMKPRPRPVAYISAQTMRGAYSRQACRQAPLPVRPAPNHLRVPRNPSCPDRSCALDRYICRRGNKVLLLGQTSASLNIGSYHIVCPDISRCLSSYTSWSSRALPYTEHLPTTRNHSVAVHTHGSSHLWPFQPYNHLVVSHRGPYMFGSISANRRKARNHGLRHSGGISISCGHCSWHPSNRCSRPIYVQIPSIVPCRLVCRPPYHQ